MRKIMFSDKYGLTKAVLDGRKTMTRSVIPTKAIEYILGEFKQEYFEGTLDVFDTDKKYIEQYYLVEKCGKCFRPGDIVAVAQKYKDFRWPAPQRGDFQEILHSAGWNNKMYVRADLMPHKIRITNIRVERLQEISDEDCLREGILEDSPGLQYSFPTNIGYCGQYPFDTPRDAFAALIDRVSSRGTWKSNPWVFVYEFELVK